MDEEATPVEQELEVFEPIILKLGKQKRKQIKRLTKGEGKLWQEIDDVIAEVGEALGDELDGKIILPLVLVYREVPKRKRAARLFDL